MIAIEENGIFLNIDITESQEVRLLHLSSRAAGKPIAEQKSKWYRLLEMQLAGFDQDDHHGNKHTGCNPSKIMKYKEHKDYRNEWGRKLEITQAYKGMIATTHFQLYDGISVIKSWNEVINEDTERQSLEYLSSLTLTGLSEDSSLPRDQDCMIWLPHNTWFGEASWKSYSPNTLGYDKVFLFSMKRISLSNTGSWGCSEYLPMGSYQNMELNKTITWQIETSGSWHWEISDIADELYLQISGPTYQENNFIKHLSQGECFSSVPCAVAIVNGDFEKSIGELTKYRRRIRRPNNDNEKLPVIFNDYMNCLMGNPTTEALKPLINSAKESGCEYFCIDCGWYADESWWDSVGEWQPSMKRFPGGINEVIDYIRSKEMIPGLWLEIEVMGISCPLVNKVPKSWFFQRNGKPVIDHNRYQLDFRNSEVREFADEVIRRLVEEYGVGYIKMDYNINAGVGTDYQSDSAGEGLLAHTRAYLDWVDEVFQRYPDLIIENCSSGGMRMEYSLLQRHSIQSVTDQMDYIKMAAIAANCPTACTPEQAAVWSYPLRDNDVEETIFNMVNAMLFRIHQSGYLSQISEERLHYVKEGIAYYKTIREDIKDGLPFWPIGLADFSDEYISVGLKCGKKQYVAVWRTKKEKANSIVLKMAIKDTSAVQCGYPKDIPVKYRCSDMGLEVFLEPKTARIFEIMG